ncbi:MAG: methylated-DNA--[protein]-cysteine S-methyltransferase [Candidatus Dormibacteria bacterium]
MSDLAAPRSCGYASTPLGRVLVVTAGRALLGLFFVGRPRRPSLPEAGAAPEETLDVVRMQLNEYFQGRRTRFELPLRLEGTPFQIAVWSALLDIPYGTTSTYEGLATQIGRPRAARAVGAANGRNPISIIVPCHRLVGADGGLTGYGGGIHRKQSLLKLECATPCRSRSDRRSAG